jgi:hypothetical protein
VRIQRNSDFKVFLEGNKAEEWIMQTEELFVKAWEDIMLRNKELCGLYRK